MSYLRANKVGQMESDADTDGFEHGFRLAPVNFEATPTLDHNLDDEQLSFVLSLIELVDNLAEGEAIVVWKEIF